MKKRKIGIGTTSLVLFIIGSLFAFTFNKICIGDNILNYIGLKSWSNGNQGTHYTIFYSLLFYIPSLIIGYKFSNILSTIMVTIIIVTSLLFTAII